MIDILIFLFDKYPLGTVMIVAACFAFILLGLRIQKQNNSETEVVASNAEVAKTSTVKAFELMDLFREATEKLMEAEKRVTNLEQSVSILQLEDKTKTEKIVQLSIELTSLKSQLSKLLLDIGIKENENKLLINRVRLLEQKINYLEQLLRENHIEFSYEKEGI